MADSGSLEHQRRSRFFRRTSRHHRVSYAKMTRTGYAILQVSVPASSCHSSPFVGQVNYILNIKVYWVIKSRNNPRPTGRMPQ